MKEIITKEMAIEMATEMIEEYLLASYGQRLVSDWENPFQPYIQEQNSWSQAGEVFSVACPGFGNLDISGFREGWDCDHLEDAEVIQLCCRDGDMSEYIEELADKIYESANEGE